MKGGAWGVAGEGLRGLSGDVRGFAPREWGCASAGSPGENQDFNAAAIMRRRGWGWGGWWPASRTRTASLVAARPFPDPQDQVGMYRADKRLLRNWGNGLVEVSCLWEEGGQGVLDFRFQCFKAVSLRRPENPLLDP